MHTNNTLVYGEIVPNLKVIPDKSLDLVYFNIPNRLRKASIEKELVEVYLNYFDEFEYSGHQRDYLESLIPIIFEIKRITKPDGALLLQGEPSRTHYIKALLLDKFFGSNNFYNEIIWVTKEKTKNRLWPENHQNILMYVLGSNFQFHPQDVDRIDYMAPGLQSKKRRDKKKFPTDTWWFTQINERDMLRRLIVSSSPKNGVVLGITPRNNDFADICLEEEKSFRIIEKSKIHAKKLWKVKQHHDSIKWIGEIPNGK